MQSTHDALIDTFRSDDHQAFAALNRAWLTEYGLLEAPDERQLTDPVGQIVMPGGQIFVARRNGEVVGTCAVLPHDEGVLELLKLAVAPAAQGLGLGRRLVEACLSYARARGAQRLVLLSNSKLGAALRLYEGLGFRRAPMPVDAVYVTADVYMEIDLTALPADRPTQAADGPDGPGRCTRSALE
jgi:ribosomal protein S18 acetylase RimI-like enzyme